MNYTAAPYRAFVQQAKPAQGSIRTLEAESLCPAPHYIYMNRISRYPQYKGRQLLFKQRLSNRHIGFCLERKGLFEDRAVTWDWFLFAIGNWNSEMGKRFRRSTDRNCMFEMNKYDRH